MIDDSDLDDRYKAGRWFYMAVALALFVGLLFAAAGLFAAGAFLLLTVR